MRKVIVIGGVHHNTLGVIRSLGYQGIRPYVICTTTEKDPYILHSQYIKQFWIMREDKLVDFLVCTFHDEEEKPIIIACADSLASLLDVNLNLLREYFLLPGSSVQGRLTKFMDKETMRNQAIQSGFLTPDSVVADLRSNTEIHLPFPWIIKPLVSKNGSKTDIRRIYNQQDWRQYKQEMHYEYVQVQKLIDKDFEYQLIGCSLSGGTILIIPGVARCINPSKVTNTGFLHYEPLDGWNLPIESCRKFMKAVGYEGLFSMEFLRGKDGKDYFMETNFRNDGNAICVTASGVNLPMIWVKYKSGENINELNSIVCKSVYANPEFNDFYLMATRQISFSAWLRDIKNTDVFMEFDGTDPKPFFVLLRQYFIHCIKRVLHFKIN